MTEHLRKLLEMVDTLTIACLEISRCDHEKIDLATQRDPKLHAALCDAVMTVRTNLETRSAVKNEIDRTYSAIVSELADKDVDTTTQIFDYSCS